LIHTFILTGKRDGDKQRNINGIIKEHIMNINLWHRAPEGSGYPHFKSTAGLKYGGNNAL
jgi:hypothetical protein